MAAAPKVFNMRFEGKSGNKYAYSVYISDVNAAFVTFALTGTAGTGSTNFIMAPEDMKLIDFSGPTGLTDTTTGVIWLDDAPIRGGVLTWANCLNTLPSRSFPDIGIKGGRKVQIQQLT